MVANTNREPRKACLQANHPDSEDIGPISLVFKRDETQIHLELGKPVEWLCLTTDVARTIAHQLITLANEIDKPKQARLGG